jgi:hypothetical protein
MILVKSALAGLVAVAGTFVLLLLFGLFIVHIVIPILGHVGPFAGIGFGAIAFDVRHAAATAGVIFLLGFAWEYRREKARQAR